MKKNDGGSAFPLIEKNYIGDGQYEESVSEGMTLRDYFAGQAIKHLISRKRDGEFSLAPEKSAEMSYRIADAMIIQIDK